METEYYVFLHSPGPNWLDGKPITAQPLGGHFEYMDQLEAEKKLILGGGFTDHSGAMGVLRVSRLGEAREIVDNDPAVKDGIVTAEVHPWYVTVAGQVELSGH